MHSAAFWSSTFNIQAHLKTQYNNQIQCNLPEPLYSSIGTTQVPQNMTCKGAELTFLRGFADMRPSLHDGLLELFQVK